MALTPREIRVLHLRYRKGYSIKETSEILGITKERVLQIEKKILSTLQ